MKTAIAHINRLGNRLQNEDRLTVAEDGDSILLVVADGMGGHGGGDIAAQVLVDTLDQYFRSSKKPIVSPRAFLRNAIEGAHANILKAGKKLQPPIEPRTTCVACIIQGNRVAWAHVGDSRLYLLRDGGILARTIDHSYVEELFKKGLISESDMLTHPKRSYITQCVGALNHLPDISYTERDDLRPDDVLLLCSDGLWSALKDNDLHRLPGKIDLDRALNDLASRAESNTYPQSDNISAIALRMLDPSTTNYNTKHSTQAVETESSRNTVNHAISAINKALEDYSDEMDYDPKTK
jgi:serine/threonine protein phosphatase PrpC